MSVDQVTITVSTQTIRHGIYFDQNGGEALIGSEIYKYDEICFPNTVSKTKPRSNHMDPP